MSANGKQSCFEFKYEEMGQNKEERRIKVAFENKKHVTF